MDNLSFFWIFLIIITCGFGAILYLLVTHNSDSDKEDNEDKKDEKVSVKVDPFKGLTDRQKNILEFMISKKIAKPAELSKVAGDVSSRTMRRDMDVLVEKGVVSQEGSTKSTYYKYIGN